jgi:hypothetical protein
MIKICSCGDALATVSPHAVFRLNDQKLELPESLESTYLRHTSHRTGGELVDEGEGLLGSVGHDGRRLGDLSAGMAVSMERLSSCEHIEVESEKLKPFRAINLPQRPKN